MNIIDIPVGQFRRALRSVGSRRRTPETVQLVEAIQWVGSERAKAIVLDAGENLAKVRAKLMYAARIVGIRLQVVVTDDRVLFSRGPGRPRARS